MALFNAQNSEEQESEEQKPTDWSGVIIGVVLLPVFLLFMHAGKEDLGLNISVCLLGVLLAVKIRWALKMRLWFWGVIVLVLALQLPFILMIHWPRGWVPGVFLLPIAFASFLITIGAIRFVEKFVKAPPTDKEE
jgi:hypothetical protein